MQHYFAAMRAVENVDGLWDVLTGFFGERGISYVCAIEIPPPGATDQGEVRIRGHGYPGEWMRRYVREKLFERDPIPAHARSHPTPFRRSDIEKIRSLTDEERNFLAEFDELGIKGGVAIPIFGPHGRNGYLGVAPEPGRAPVTEEEMQQFQSAAQVAHQRYCELIFEEQGPPVALSPREKEILEWVARGKSNASIAGILDISANTVDTYLRRIYEKLDVSDRTVAAIRGIGCGLIDP